MIITESSKIKLILSYIFSFGVMFFEPYLALVQSLAILVILDIITGLLASRKEGKHLSSKSLWPKVPRVGLFLIALAAAQVSSPLLVEFGLDAHQAGKWFCSLYGLYELFSIMENLGRLGLPVARQFLQLLRSRLPEDIQTLTDPKKPE